MAYDLKTLQPQQGVAHKNYLVTDIDETARAIEVTAGRRLVFASWENNANAADTFLKLYDVAVGGVTVGTTVPKVIIHCEASKDGYVFFGANGPVFDTAITAAAVTAGGTGGATGPTSQFNCEFITT